MGIDNWHEAIKKVIQSEGGLASRPLSHDPGGLTNFGITQSLYHILGYKGSVKNLTKKEAAKFYYDEFVKRYGLKNKLAEYPKLQYFLLDASVHHGNRRAVQFFQIAASIGSGQNLKIDGVWGPKTEEAIAYSLGIDENGENTFLDLLVAIRYTYLWTRPHARFNPGWFTRVLAFLK